MTRGTRPRAVGTVLALVALVAAFPFLEATMADDALPDFDELWDFRNPGETEAKFREILPAARESGNKDYLAQLISQIARTRGLQRDFDGAHELLDEAETIAPPDCTKAWVRIWLERGRTLRSSGKKDEAHPYFLKAYVQSHKAGGMDGLMIDAVHMLALVVDPDDSLQWNELAIDLAEKSDDPDAKKWLGSLYNNTGWSHHSKGNFEAALDYWERQLAFFQARPKTKLQQMLIAKWMVARGLRSLERYEEALERQKAILAEYEAGELEESGYTSEEIGENLLALGREDEAKPWFAKAYAKLSKDEWLMENEAERMARMKKLGGVEGEDE